MKTQVAIVGAGPAGSLLAHLLARRGIESVVLERQSRDYVLGRIRAGVLEWSTVEILRDAEAGERMDAEGTIHDAVNIGWRGEDILSIDLAGLGGSHMMAYGQTKLQEDLYRIADETGLQIVFEADNVELHDVTTASPFVTCSVGGEQLRVDSDLIAGCDGFHGVSRSTIPADAIAEFEKVYPIGWLGILSETPPLPDLIYVNHERGFALCSQREPMLSRYYVQCPLDDTTDDWPDDRFWTELLARVPSTMATEIVTGPSIEKSIAPLRSFVCEPIRWGNLFLAGDAAHIVPPTGAKGLNLAMSDVWYLANAVAAHYAGDDSLLDAYSDTALARVWSSVRFSWWLTSILHRFPDQTEFDQRMQEQELTYLASSTAAMTSFARQYVGLPL